MNIIPVVNQIIMLFIIAGVGLLLRRIGAFPDPVIKGLNQIILTVTWPAMMLMTTQKPYTPEALSGFFTVLIGSIAVMTIAMGAALWIFRRETDKLRPVLVMLAVMPNAGYMGMPIIQAAYGDGAMLYLAAYIVGFNVVMWTFAVALYTGFRLKSLSGLTSPGFICAIIGVALFLAKIQLPTPILSAVNQLGAVNTPLSMLLLGSRIASLGFSELKDGKMWFATALKLLVIPFIALFCFKAMGIEGLTLGVLALCTAMPAASAGQMLSERYDAEVGVAAKGISISTLCSIVSIPLILLMMGV